MGESARGIRRRVLLPFDFGDLVDTALVPATLEGRVEPEGQNLVREPESDDAGAKREDVRVVVLARQAGRVQIVAQRSARAEYFVGGHLLALSAAADDNPAIRPSGRNRPGDARADSRIVDRHDAIGAMIVDLVPETRQRRHEVQFEREPGVIGTNRDAHDAAIIYSVGGRQSSVGSRSRQVSLQSTVIFLEDDSEPPEP